jgi:hypothetical protein
VTISNAHCRAAGRLLVALPREHAFRLFTPRGEQEWVPQWKPHSSCSKDFAALREDQSVRAGGGLSPLTAQAGIPGGPRDGGQAPWRR